MSIFDRSVGKRRDFAGIAPGLQGLAQASSGVVTGLGAISQSRAIQAQSQFRSDQLQFNAKLSELQAEDAIARGNEAIQDFSARVRQRQGSQRAAIAAQGVDVGSGSAVEIAEDTRRTAQDAVTRLRNNAWREAWGFRVQAIDQRSQANLARIAGDFNAAQTLLTGGLRAGAFALQAGNLSAQALENLFQRQQQGETFTPDLDLDKILRGDPFDPGDDPFGIGGFS